MQLQSEQRPTIGYVVSTWPRLSQTFVAARAKVEEHFSIDRGASRLLELFAPSLQKGFRPAQSLWPISLPGPMKRLAELKDAPEGRGRGRVKSCLN